MKAKELADRLEYLIQEYGDLDLCFDFLGNGRDIEGVEDYYAEGVNPFFNIV